MAQIVMRTLLNRSVNISSLATNLVIACTLAYLLRAISRGTETNHGGMSRGMV